MVIHDQIVTGRQATEEVARWADFAGSYPPNHRDQLEQGLGRVDETGTARARRVEGATAGTIPLEWTRVKGIEPNGTLLYLHGGGYFPGSIATHRRLVAPLSAAAGVGGLSVDCRPAPEHPFPAAGDDAVAAHRWLISRAGERPDRVIIAGDSAGGGFTFATLWPCATPAPRSRTGDSAYRPGRTWPGPASR